MSIAEWQGEETSTPSWWPQQDESLWHDGPQTASAVEEACWFGKGSQSLQSPLSAMRTSVTSLKAPPRMQPGQTWFDYEKVVRDWMVVAEVEKEKRGTLLKLSLEGSMGELYKTLLDDARLVKKDGAEYFLTTLRPHFVKGCIQTFLHHFLQLNGCRRGNSDFREWLLRLQHRKSEAYSAWMELCPLLKAENPDVVAEIRAYFQPRFEELMAERVPQLRQANQGLSEQEIREEATRQINREIADLAGKIKQ